MGVLLTTPPSISSLSPIATGGKNPGVAQVVELKVPLHDLAQATLRNKVVAPAGKAAHDGPQAERERVAPLDFVPGPGELPRGRGRLRTRCDEGSVEGAHRGSHEQVCRDPSLIESAHHADLKRSQARAAREHERRARTARAGCHERWGSRIPRTPSRGGVSGL